MAIMSLRAYARHRGVELSAVQKAIKTGRISTQPDGRIDSEQADVEWEQNTRHRVASGKRNDDDDESPVFGASQYTKARTVYEHFRAKLAQLEYQERIATLIPKDEVKVAAFNKFSAVPRSHAQHPGSRGRSGGRRKRSRDVLRSSRD